MASKRNNEPLRHCMFCGRSEKEVPFLLQGLEGCICSDCVEIAKDYLQEIQGGKKARPQGRLGRVGLQPLQAHQPQPGGRGAGRGTGEEQHPPLRPYGNRQDPAGQDDSPDAGRAVHHRGRHGPHRGGLRGRGRGEHPLAPAAGGRLRRGQDRAGHRLHRRNRQDRPQER